MKEKYLWIIERLEENEIKADKCFTDYRIKTKDAYNASISKRLRKLAKKILQNG